MMYGETVVVCSENYEHIRHSVGEVRGLQYSDTSANEDNSFRNHIR